MKQVVRYQSDDGHLFLTGDEASARDNLLAKVNQALSKLVKHPGDHDGYVQQKGSAVLYCKEVAVEISEIEYPHRMWRHQTPDKIDAGSVGRSLNYDSVAMRLWSRLSCIDESFREWGQPFFVYNPDKRIMIELKGEFSL